MKKSNPFAKAHRQAKFIPKSKRKKQSIRTFFKHLREALSAND